MSRTKYPPHRDGRDPYRDYPSWEDRERELEAKPFRVTARWLAGGIALILAVIAGLWAFNVGTSDVKGQGDAIRQKNDATNRIQRQERFEDLASAFTAYPSRIAVAEQAVDRAATTPDTYDDQIKATELDGIRQQCMETATNYNADSRKYTAQDFKAADLPASLNPQECSK